MEVPESYPALIQINPARRRFLRCLDSALNFFEN